MLNKVAGYFSVDGLKDNNVHPSDEGKIIPMLDIALANLLNIYQVLCILNITFCSEFGCIYICNWGGEVFYYLCVFLSYQIQ